MLRRIISWWRGEKELAEFDALVRASDEANKARRDAQWERAIHADNDANLVDQDVSAAHVAAIRKRLEQDR